MTDFERYLTMDWSSDADECEAGCGTIMAEGAYVEGRYGHYCSPGCAAGEDDDSLSDEEERAIERKQMGICS